MPAKIEGSTWLHNYDGKLWPVILCDDDTPPDTFMRSRPGAYVTPAILLGKLIYIWVADNQLKVFDPHKEYIRGKPFETGEVLDTDSKEVQLEKTRRKAFMADALLFETPAFWKNVIEQRSKARALEREMAGKRKRSRSNDDLEIVSVRRSTSSSASSSKRQCEHRRQSRNGYPPTPVSSSKKRVSSDGDIQTQEDSDDDLFVRDVNSQSDPFVSSQSSESEREKNRRSIQENPPDDATCTIFVGQDHVPFLVRKYESGVGECDFLADRVKFTEEHKSHINLDMYWLYANFTLYEHIKITPRDFLPIADYLQKGEFEPRLIYSHTTQRLDGVVLPDEEDAAATNIAKIYLTASKIQFAALQLLCVNKLKALYPIKSINLLMVLQIATKAKAYGCDAEHEIKDWLVDYLAGHFWTLMEFEGRTLARLLPDCGDIWRCVADKLRQKATEGLDV